MAAGRNTKQWRRLAELRLHPAAGLVPAMSEAEFAVFCSDVARHGLEQPLAITADGEILDGRHRYRAALALALARVPVQLVETSDPIEYLLRSALLRRQLNASQKAVLGIELARLEVATLPPRGGRLRDRAAELAGVCPRTVQDVLTVEAAEAALFEQIKSGEIPAHTARLELHRRERYATIGAASPLPAGRFELIYADPPWRTSNPGSAYAPEQYYPTMPLDELKKLRVPAADDALLYLWVIHAELPEGLELMDAWGFSYCGDEVWVKDRIGLGVWSRYRHEQLLIGRRGTASPPEPKRRLESVIEAPRGRHSAKPTCVYERLEHLYPHLTKLELFARGTPRPGWTAWGNQVEEVM